MDSREEIRARMLKYAAQTWGYQESEMETAAFDPLVGLLMGACATELEKINRAITSSRERIINRLIETLIPDVHVNALPAHAIVHARSIEPYYYSKYTDEVYTSKKDDQGERDIFFSSANNYRIIDGDIRYLALGNQILKVDDIPYRDELIYSEKSPGVENACLWLGIDVSHKLKDITDIQFFFDWKNEPDKKRFFNLLGATKWYFEGAELEVGRGYIKKEHHKYAEIQSPFEKDYDPTERRIQEIEAFYHDHFIKIEGWKGEKSEFNIQDLKALYPQELEQAFSVEELAVIEERTIWIKVEFPRFFPASALLKTECYINCFPVMNRRLHQPPNIRLSNYLNIIPLECEPFYFDIGKVINQNEVRYHEIPLTNIRRFKSGRYTLRRRGVRRFNAREASHKLYELIDLLRDESTAFGAYDLAYLNTKVRTLTQEMTDLEQHVMDNSHLQETIPYLMVKPLDYGEYINIEYWSTNGEDGNQIQTGAILDMYKFTSFKRDSIKMVTFSRGGQNELGESEKEYLYKRALISRERIVTIEDIKAYCWSKLRDKADTINVDKGYKISDDPKKGIIRTQEVLIKPGRNAPDNLEELALLLEELELELNKRSASVIPIVIKLQ